MLAAMLSSRSVLAAALTATMLLTAVPEVSAQAPQGASGPAGVHTELARFHLGGGSRGFGRSGAFGRSRTGGRGIIRRVVHALTVAYLFHLLFTTPGGWLLILALILFVFWLARRGRRVMRY